MSQSKIWVSQSMTHDGINFQAGLAGSTSMIKLTSSVGAGPAGLRPGSLSGRLGDGRPPGVDGRRPPGGGAGGLLLYPVPVV